MRFSELLQKEEYKPNPQARVKDKAAAITRLIRDVYDSLDEAVKTGAVSVGSRRDYMDLNEYIKSQGGKPVLDRNANERKLLVEDFDIQPDSMGWVEDFFDSKRSYGPRKTHKRQVSGGSLEYRNFKDAVAEANALLNNSKATKEQFRDSLYYLLECLIAYGQNINALKGAIQPIMEQVEAEVDAVMSKRGKPN